MTIQHSTRDLFRIMFKYARNEVKVRNATSAFWAAEAAADAYFHNFGYGLGIDHVLAVNRAVLWAIHWRFFNPVKKLPLWASERRIAWVADEHHSRRWFEPARLPG